MTCRNPALKAANREQGSEVGATAGGSRDLFHFSSYSPAALSASLQQLFIWAVAVIGLSGAGRALLTPAGYSTHPAPIPSWHSTPAPQDFPQNHISNGSQDQGTFDICLACHPAQLCLFDCLFPRLSSHGLSTHGCCSHHLLHFQQLPEYKVYFSESILEKNLVLEGENRGGSPKSPCFSLYFKSKCSSEIGCPY